MFSSYGVYQFKVYCPINIGEDCQVDFTKHAEFTQSRSIHLARLNRNFNTFYHFTYPTCVPKTVVISASFFCILIIVHLWIAGYHYGGWRPIFMDVSRPEEWLLVVCPDLDDLNGWYDPPKSGK